MRDSTITQVDPGAHAAPAEADLERNCDFEGFSRWGERAWVWSCHREGGDHLRHADNLDRAEGEPGPDAVTPSRPRRASLRWSVMP